MFKLISSVAILLMLIFTLILSSPLRADVHDPVVLIAGTGADVGAMMPLARHLRHKRRTVHIVDLVDKGFARTDVSVAKISAFIDRVLASEGVTEVDVLGWSQGAHIARRYLQTHGTDKVDTLVMLGSPTYEWQWMTYLYGFTKGHCLTLGNCTDQHSGSQVLQEMNGGLDMPYGVKVVNVWTDFDFIVTPPGHVSKLRDGNTGSQYSIQSVCPARWVGHFGLVNDRIAHRIADTALRNQHPRWWWDCFSFSHIF
ncbi:MAG: alpha/beta fold hydrolase [Pseudomonadota bacterium]